MLGLTMPSSRGFALQGISVKNVTTPVLCAVPSASLLAK